MSSHHIPIFSGVGLCEGYENPDIWFPEPIRNNQTNHYRSADSMYARSMCNLCPVKSECFDYSIKYTGLHGIWAGLDPRERSEIQDNSNIQTIDLRETLPKIYEQNAGASRMLSDAELHG